MTAPLVASVIFGLLAIGGLLYTSSSSPEARVYFMPTLFFTAGGVALFLGWMIAQWIGLTRKLRSRVYGTGLILRAFRQLALMALVPGVSSLLVAHVLLNFSVTSWFDTQYASAQQAGQELQAKIRDDLKAQLSETTLFIGRRMSEAGHERRPRLLEDYMAGYGLQRIAWYDSQRREKGYRDELFTITPQHPPPEAFDMAQRTGLWAKIETPRGPDPTALQISVLAWVTPVQASRASFYVYVQRPIGKELAQFITQMDARDAAEQQRVRQQSTEQRKLWRWVLSLVLLLSLFVALALAFVFAERWVAPLRSLGQGQRAVARGKYEPLPETTRSQDELGQLIQGFNGMTEQLAAKEVALQAQRDQLQQGKAYLEDLLASLSTAVVTLDSQFRVRLVNPQAEAVLDCAAVDLIGLPLLEWGVPESSLRQLGTILDAHFTAAQGARWQDEQVEYWVGEGSHKVRHILLVRGMAISAGSAPEYALSFDDISHLLKVQKEAAWGEVARRLAHEVKNPLTPIQLSIERLQYRLADKIDPVLHAMVDQATATIIQQVNAIRSLVEAFSHYAKTPAPVIRRLDINALVREVQTLYEGQTVLHIDLAPDLPPAAADRTLMNRVLVNLIKNAMEALADLAGKPEFADTVPRVLVRTGTTAEGLYLSVEDNGPGFSERQLARVFEPYATTKPRGSGLGLPIVKRIIEEHHGQISVHNVAPHGAVINITLPRMEENQTGNGASAGHNTV